MAHLIRVMGVSERFACRVTGQNRTTQVTPAGGGLDRRSGRRLRGWLRVWAKNHPRRGFRNACHDARGKGWHVNHNKIRRLWREEGLRVPPQAATQAPWHVHDTEPAGRRRPEHGLGRRLPVRRRD